MTPERWRRLKELFGEAVERTGDERASFLVVSALGSSSSPQQSHLQARGGDASGIGPPFGAGALVRVVERARQGPADPEAQPQAPRFQERLCEPVALAPESGEQMFEQRFRGNHADLALR